MVINPNQLSSPGSVISQSCMALQSSSCNTSYKSYYRRGLQNMSFRSSAERSMTKQSITIGVGPKRYVGPDMTFGYRTSPKQRLCRRHLTRSHDCRITTSPTEQVSDAPNRDECPMTPDAIHLVSIRFLGVSFTSLRTATSIMSRSTVSPWL